MTATHFNLLIAEDDDLLRQTYAMLLQRSGHTVVAVENGAEAVAHLDTHEVDLVIMDIDMPVLNGLDAAHEIRQRETHTRTPMFCLTGRHDAGLSDRAVRSGFDASYAKPITFPELLAAIQRHASSVRCVLSFPQQPAAPVEYAACA